MKTTFLSTTNTGKWSIRLFVLFILLMISGGAASRVINNRIEYPNPINSPILGTLIYLAFIAAAAASISGIRACLKFKERSVMVYIVIAIGGYFFLAGATLFIFGMAELLRSYF